LADHYITFNSETGSYGNEKLLDTIKNFANEDELIISIDTRDSVRLRNVTETLDKKGFEYMTKGSDDGRMYSIIAHLKR